MEVATAVATKVAEEMEVGTLVGEEREAMLEVQRVEVIVVAAAKAPEGEARVVVVGEVVAAVVAKSHVATTATLAMAFSKRPPSREGNRPRSFAARRYR